MIHGLFRFKFTEMACKCASNAAVVDIIILFCTGLSVIVRSACTIVINYIGINKV